MRQHSPLNNPMRYCTIILLISFVLASIIPATAQDITFPEGDFAELRFYRQAEVQRVIDPLTLQLESGEIVHLVGLDIPDFNTREPGPLSLMSMKVLNDMLTGQRVGLYQTKQKTRGRKNRFGQPHVHIERASDKAWVQGTLITLGIARVMTGQHNPEMAAQMYKIEAQARAEKIGLWANQQYAVKTPETLDPNAREFTIVEGTVQSAAIKNNRIYLNFGPDWRTDFTVTVKPEDKRTFSKSGIDPLAFNNKHLRVRGWLDEYNGPYIEINHPQAIEVLE